ncbi:hypothetical protein V5N11_020578 [Cardamine amara subsp. amara]|uniref:DC1 domain-containing protein n=1 Tax=Cardamine amara subsp. amara TaxID=228776 RepID=A0ABD1ATE4_CARAN
MHPQHELRLVFKGPEQTHQDKRMCNICDESVEGLYYQCEPCGFDVQPICSQLPQHVSHVHHSDHLRAESSAGSKQHVHGLPPYNPVLAIQVWSMQVRCSHGMRSFVCISSSNGNSAKVFRVSSTAILYPSDLPALLQSRTHLRIRSRAHLRI